MAVYTHISADDVKQYLTLFNIGALVSHEGITEGVENTNYRLTTSQGLYILTLFEKRIRAEDLPFFISFMNYLRAGGISCPGVVAAKNGESIIPLNGKPAIITTFLQGQWPRQQEVFHAAAVGTTLAQMHKLGLGFGQMRDNSMALPAWRDLIDKCGERANEVEMSLPDLLQEELRYQEQNGPAALPFGAVHADLFPDNVFFDGKNISGVIDFYFACTDFLAYDLMLTANAWCFRDGALEREKFSALLHAYQKERALSAEELRYLPFFGRAAALRIISTRLYDWLHPRPGAIVKMKDPMEYVKILRFYRTQSLPL